MTVGHGECPVLEPGQTFCYQVSDPELGCGSVWSVNTVPTKGDVYVKHVEGQVWVHSSFHHSGQWHYSLTEAAMIANPGDESHFAIQREHTKLASGWEHAHRVIVERTELRHNHEVVAGCQVMAIPMPHGCDAIAVDVFLRAPSASGLLEFNSADRLIAVMKRGDGGFVLILAHLIELPAGLVAWRSQEIADIKLQMKKHGWEGQPKRVVILGLGEDDFHCEIEVAIDGP